MTAVHVQLPEKLEGLFQPRQFKVLHGGRGGGKSHGVAQWLILEAMAASHRILCVREVQKSLAESSMQVIKDYIKRMGVSAYFEVLKTEIRCHLTGSTFAFSGLKDHTADSIKSFEGATRVWVEEAHSVTAHAQMIRAKRRRPSIVLVMPASSPRRFPYSSFGAVDAPKGCMQPV